MASNGETPNTMVNTGVNTSVNTGVDFNLVFGLQVNTIHKHSVSAQHQCQHHC